MQASHVVATTAVSSAGVILLSFIWKWKTGTDLPNDVALAGATLLSSLGHFLLRYMPVPKTA